MTIIRKHCERCKKKVSPRKGWYFALTSRLSRDRYNGFFCEKCAEKFLKWNGEGKK